MFEIVILIVIQLLCLLVGYVVSVFANTVYINRDEIEEVFPELSASRKQRLEKFATNPRAFFQVAYLVRITAAIILGIISFRLSLTVAAFHLIPAAGVYIAIFFSTWFLAILAFVYFPRRSLRISTKDRLIRFLPLINFIYILTLPAISLIKKIVPPRQAETIPEDQKDDIVERAIETLAESAGISTPIIEKDEKEMIHQIFQLDVTEVREIMIPRVDMVAFDQNTDLETIKRTTREYGFSRYPVFEQSIDNIIGIIKVKDLLQLGEDQKQKFRLLDHIRTPVVVGEQRKIDQLLAEFKRSKTHMAVVLDEFGGTAGLVTLEDVLEEIVGDIRDEDDTKEETEITRLEDGNLLVSGACPLEELAEELDIELRQDEFETVGGMIYDIVGSVPAEGTILTWENCKLRVMEVEGQRIKNILVIPSANQQS
jgi:CBS domain containing-hemolysin-like protein